jgi:3-oxoacyl-[acyl-carrier protein] reductase
MMPGAPIASMYPSGSFTQSVRIINIASIAGVSGLTAHSPHYSATKGAVSVAMEVAGANIYVNAIAAGGILTPQFKDNLARSSEKEKNEFFQLIPSGRLGAPEEYAFLITYLASDDHYLVGQIIGVNGGTYI